MRWLTGITDSMDMSKLQEIVKEREAGMVQSMGLQRVGHNLVAEQQQHTQRDSKRSLQSAHSFARSNS